MQVSAAGSNAFIAASLSVRRTSRTYKVQGVQRQLSPEEKQKIVELKQTDREVRVHEQGHKSAAGSYAQGGPSFEYTQGPDGKRYAVAGEVQIDTGEVEGNPQATVRKMQVVRRAALTPQDPSPQDRAVAAEASAKEAAARAALRREQAEEGGDLETGRSGPRRDQRIAAFQRIAEDGETGRFVRAQV